MQNQQRQLAAILFTDIVGYTALMQENEQKAVALIKHYNTALNETVDLHNGKILNYYGDGSLCIFPSVTEAMSCAVELQKELQTEPKVPLRIGLHVGEVFFENEKALGDGVNVASRIQSLGQANTIFFSKEIFDKIRNQPQFKPVSIGFFEFKNVDQPMEVFALANEGLNIPKKETLKGKLKTDLTKNNKRVGRNIIIAASIVILLIGGFFIYTMFFKKSGFTGEQKSIAVLPFTNMSNDKENEFFSDGMTEEITTQLSKIADLKVINTASTILYKGTKKSVKEIAEELGVLSVLKGSVQRAGDEIRVSTQLIDANTQKNIWANTYDREFKEVFAIQSELAQEIAHQLNAKLTKDEKKQIEKTPTDNPKAYEYFLQGTQLHDKFHETLKPEYYTNSKAMFEKAISLDSNYALAHAGLADLFNTYTESVNNDSSLLALQQQEIEKAWLIDSNLAYVNLSRAYVWLTYNKTEDAYKNFKRAVELAPNNSRNLFGLAQILSRFGLIEESKAVIQKTIKVNPLSAANFGFLGRIELDLYNLNNAAGNFQTALQLEPDYRTGLIFLGYIYSVKNELEEAKKILDKYERINQPVSGFEQYVACIYATLGNKKKALDLSNDWRVYLAFGMKEEGLAALKKDDQDRDPLLNDYILLKNHSQHKDFDLIRNDPLFLQLLDKKRIQYEINKKKFSIAGTLN